MNSETNETKEVIRLGLNYTEGAIQEFETIAYRLWDAAGHPDTPQRFRARVQYIGNVLAEAANDAKRALTDLAYLSEELKEGD